MDEPTLSQTFELVDQRIAELEHKINQGNPGPLLSIVTETITLVKELIIAYLKDVGDKTIPDSKEDILEVFKILVKGDPSWNTIRDNCRELVYYQNCINLHREDALPVAPEKMAVRTARHIFLFMKTRSLREGRLVT